MDSCTPWLVRLPQEERQPAAACPRTAQLCEVGGDDAGHMLPVPGGAQALQEHGAGAVQHSIQPGCPCLPVLSSATTQTVRSCLDADHLEPGRHACRLDAVRAASLGPVLVAVAGTRGAQ